MSIIETPIDKHYDGAIQDTLMSHFDGITLRNQLYIYICVSRKASSTYD